MNVSQTYEARTWTRSVSFLSGVSSFRKTFSATPRSLSSSNSRYFCCRSKNLSQVVSAPSDKGNPTCVEPFGLPNDCLSFRHDEGFLVVFPSPSPKETPPSLSADSVPNKSVSASSHSPSCTALRKAATLGISSWYPLSRDSCSAAFWYPRSDSDCNSIRVISSLS